jgi:hypothetical protein
VRTELALRVVCPARVPGFSRILKVLRKSAGPVRAHLVDRLHDPAQAFFLCERPEEGARALERDGQEVETETVITVRTPNRPGTFSHLVETLEAEEIEVLYSYSTAMEDELLIVLRTGDNPKAEDALRSFLVLPDPSIPQGHTVKSDRPSGGKVPRRQSRKGSS